MKMNNPLKHDCENGCWIQKYKPEIGHIAASLPGQVAPSDIDGVIELDGNFLFLEWKSYQAELDLGQKLLFERLTEKSDDITVVVIYAVGDRGRTVKKIRKCWRGQWTEWEDCTMLDLCNKVYEWANRIRPFKRKFEIGPQTHEEAWG